jgi:hypothetical protein
MGRMIGDPQARIATSRVRGEPVFQEETKIVSLDGRLIHEFSA